MGRGTTAATLIERDDAVKVRVEEATTQRITTTAWATVNEHNRQALRRPTLVDVKHMRRFDRQLMPGVGFDLRIQGLHGTLHDRYAG